MVTFIGDVHGRYEDYLSIAQSCDFSVQVGDFGGSREWNALNYSGLNPDNHKILGGNHDDYPRCEKSPYFMGNFGIQKLGSNPPIFYIRGGHSLDKFSRVKNDMMYSYREELNFTQMIGCVKLYERIKPEIVVSHVPPTCVNREIFSPMHQECLTSFNLDADFIENTARLGEYLLSIHRPKLWVFGHLHIPYDNTLLGTKFKGLGELEQWKLSI